MMVEAQLVEIVERRLAEHARGTRPQHRPEASIGLDPAAPMARDAYGALLHTMKRGSRAQQVAAQRAHGELLLRLHCGLGNIWRLATGDRSDSALRSYLRGPLEDEARGDDHNFLYGMTVAIQRYDDFFVASTRWRDEIAAGTDPDRWLAIGRAHDAGGRHYQANAALAAARWLALAAPDAARIAAEIDEIVARRDPDLPALLRGELRGFRDAGVDRRHGHAWDMKTRGMLEVGALIAYACDHNGWVRARIYRSLGQQPMVAAVPVLLDALDDPDARARVQAALALGWIAAPGAVDRLNAVANADGDAEVRTAAAQAAERICAYWVLYGTAVPDAIERAVIEPARARGRFEAARQLAAHGLYGAAGEYLAWHDDAGVPRRAYDALARDLAPFAWPAAPWHDDEAEARDAVLAERALWFVDPEHEPDDLRALSAVARQGASSRHREGASRAADLATAPGALGWSARRALRALRLP